MSYDTISESNDSDTLPNFDGPMLPVAKAAERSSEDVTSNTAHMKNGEDAEDKGFILRDVSTPVRTNSQRGLWAGDMTVHGDNAPRRRWTSADA